MFFQKEQKKKKEKRKKERKKKKKRKTMQQNKDWYESLFPGILRCSTSLISHPLEQIKVRLQMDNSKERIKSWQIPSTVIKDFKANVGNQNPILFFYKGYPATLFSIIAKTVYKYPLLIHGPELLERSINQVFPNFSKTNHPILYQVALAPFLITVDTIMQAPQRRIKYITMTDSLSGTKTLNNKMTPGRSSTLETVRFLLKGSKEGLGFWYGSKAYFIKHGFGQVSMLFTDALIRESFINYASKDATIIASEESFSETSRKSKSPNMHNPLYIAAIALNGIFLTVLTNPLDVVMTRRVIGSQTKKDINGFFRTLVNIAKTEGVHSLFRGTSLRILPRTVTVIYTSLAISWGRGI